MISNCPICGSNDLEKLPTVISDFVADRIEFTSNNNINLCRCKNCNFGFYDYRFSPDEEKLLYKNYRDSEYQQTREKYECYYTKKVNNALNCDTKALAEQKRVINKVLDDNKFGDFGVGLDYGGNKGATFFDRIGRKEKYVYDISGVPTLPGIIGLSSIESLYKQQYDFIMSNHMFEHCTDPESIMKTLEDIGKTGTTYYIEVPYEFPFGHNKFSIRNNYKLLFNPTYNNIKLAKHYFSYRKKPFMPMHEHINFFTEESIGYMVKSHGFKVIDIQINTENGVLGESQVLSILFVK